MRPRIDTTPVEVFTVEVDLTTPRGISAETVKHVIQLTLDSLDSWAAIVAKVNGERI